MRRFLTLALLLVLASPALAGDPAKSRSAPACAVDGFACQNHCPLAKGANMRRAVGTEAAGRSAALRSEHARTLASRLAKI